MNLSKSAIIDATPEEVFQFVIDVNNEPKWRLKSVESGLKTDGPMRVGTIGYSTAEVGRGKTDSIDWKVTKYDENKHATWDLLTGPLEGSGGYLVESVSGRTKFTLEAHVRMKGPFGLLMAPIVKIIGGKMNKADVANLKKVIESQ